ncbi:MAG: hypothetical protein A2342_10005 [Gallionellales bacterium RIFOXYB12_FULL_54_9]|nr:MAG: hypothetical protein A2342_10005 [Gallionellales bacterium RIFOXYB12_FULL_54_9]
MALTSMKRESSEGMDYAPYMPGKYPGGLCIYIDEDQCEALGLTSALKAGTEVGIQAKGIVTSSTESVESDGDDKGNDVSLSVQITDMSLKVIGKVRDAASILYGS